MAALRKQVSTPLLWRFDGPGEPTYLYGTIHYGIEPEQLPPMLLRLVDTSRRIVFENAGGNSAKQDFGGPKGGYYGAPPGLFSKTALDEQLPKHLWNRLISRRKPAHVDRLRTAPAFFAAATYMDRFVTGTNRSVDLLLMDRVLLACKMPLGLEHERAGLKGLEEFTVPHLVYELEHVEEVLQWLPNLVEVWLTGDEVALHERIMDYPSARPMPTYGLEKRNKAWLPQIENYIEEGGAFIAVGSAHLLGPQGLIAVLRREGYVGKRLKTLDVSAAASDGRVLSCPPGTSANRSYFEIGENGHEVVKEGATGTAAISCQSKDTELEGPLVKCHRDGQPSDYAYVVNGAAEGPQISWYENGQIEASATLSGGQRHGIARRWHANGKLASEESYQHGKQIGETRSWDSAGALVETDVASPD